VLESVTKRKLATVQAHCALHTRLFARRKSPKSVTTPAKIVYSAAAGARSLHSKTYEAAQD
jgi:hypothetical protein